MGTPNLLLKFRIDCESELQVRGVTRIRLDGRDLLVYAAQSGAVERIEMARLQELQILRVRPSRQHLLPQPSIA